MKSKESHSLNTVFLTLLFLWLVYPDLASQEVSSMSSIDTSSVWRVNVITDEGTAGKFFYHDNFRYFLAGDTMIDDLEYQMLYKSGVSFEEDFFNQFFYNFNYYGDVYCGAIRSDGNVWYYHMNDTLNPNNDTILFDFNLDIGDTLKSWYTTNCGDIVVINIDSILVGGEYKKRYSLDGTFTGATHIIQDVGSTAGLIEPLCQFEWNFFLICFAQNGQSLWGAGNEECDLLVKVNEVEVVDGNAKAYPNPFTSSTTLSYTLDKPSTVTISIYNHQGQLIEKIEQEQPKGKQEIQWNAEGLPAGMYYFRIQAGDKVGGGKTVKMR